jgi:hypothetical protein
MNLEQQKVERELRDELASKYLVLEQLNQLFVYIFKQHRYYINHGLKLPKK